MDRITELLRLAEDSELPDTLSVWDICWLGYPVDYSQQKRFLEFLTRHIAKGTLATSGMVDLLEKDQPGHDVVTATVVGAANPFRACWDPGPPPARLPVPLLHQSALWALLDRAAFQPPPGPYLANWRDATPAPALPLSTQRVRVKASADAQRMPILLAKAKELGMDIFNFGYGQRTELQKALSEDHPGQFTDEPFRRTLELARLTSED